MQERFIGAPRPKTQIPEESYEGIDDGFDLPPEEGLFEPEITNESPKSKEYSGLAKRVIDFTRMFRELEPTVMPMARLHLFTFLKQNPHATDTDLANEYAEMRYYSEKEEKYMSKTNPLPTIGIEVEIPETEELLDYKKTFDLLDVHTDQESEMLFEVNPNFSYSPGPQARVLQELGMLDILPTQDNPVSGEREIIPGSLSLHLNFGVPEGLTFEDSETRNHVQRVTDILTYAFVTADRIKKRKTANSVLIKSGRTQKSRKMKKQARNICRLEIRPTEFSGKSTFRLIAESQLFVGGLFAKLKQDQKIKMTQSESKLADLYGKMNAEIENLFSTYGAFLGEYDRQNDSSQEIDTSLFEDKEFVAACREIVTTFGREASRIIDEAQVEK